MRETVEAIGRAARDRRVAGILVYPSFGAAGLAQVQEIRDALVAFRGQGKVTVAFADTFGELAAGNAAYYLATACEEVVLQPTGSVGLVGLKREATFLAGTLARLGVEPLFEGRHEYKSAAAQLLETGFSGPEAEQLRRVLDSQLAQIVRGIATGRGIVEADVRELVDHGPFLADEASRAGLVDVLGYRDEAIARAKERAGKGARLVLLQRYARRGPGRLPGKGRPVTVAVVTATGSIVRRSGSPLAALGGRSMDAAGTAAAIRKAYRAKGVRAVLLRVDSPGGSAVASETIYREIVLARRSGKPVVVSMGNLAASGGYYLAAGADRIVAQPGSITGSIGVIAGKLVVADAKAKLAMSVDEVHAGDHALIASVNRPFSDAEHERFAASLDGLYDAFVARVAEGRHLTVEQVDEVARGRVWTGEDALERGLIDALGGFDEALRQVREVAGLPPGARLRLQGFPGRHSLIAGLRPPRTNSTDDASAAPVARAKASPLEGVLRLYRQLAGEGGRLHVGTEPEDWFIR